MFISPSRRRHCDAVSKDTIASLRGKLGAATKRANDNQEFYLKHERDEQKLTLQRNDLAWIVLDTIATLSNIWYDSDPLIRMLRAGLKFRLDKAVPGFRAQIQKQNDERAAGNAKADAAERERREKGEDGDG